ncbi:MAG: hypothetical protein ABIJ92_00305 [Candidatus Aenigmatarchaeota archaeon]
MGDWNKLHNRLDDYNGSVRCKYAKKNFRDSGFTSGTSEGTFILSSGDPPAITIKTGKYGSESHTFYPKPDDMSEGEEAVVELVKIPSNERVYRSAALEKALGGKKGRKK